MQQRCYNPKCRSYRWYGAKGITVCGEWRESFEAFKDWAESHDYFDTAEIDRDNSEKGYSPDNCQWVTKQENLINRHSLLPTHLEKAVRELAKEQGVPAAIVIRQAVEQYIQSPASRRKRVLAG